MSELPVSQITKKQVKVLPSVPIEEEGKGQL